MENPAYWSPLQRTVNAGIEKFEQEIAAGVIRHSLVAKISQSVESYVHELEAERDRLKEQLQRVDDVLVENWISAKDGDYRKALNDLVTWNIAIENDPAVSEPAAKRKAELDELRAKVVELEALRLALTKDRDYWSYRAIGAEAELATAKDELSYHSDKGDMRHIEGEEK